MKYLMHRTVLTSRILLAALLSLFCSLAHAQWQLLPGLATDIGVSARGDAWVTGIDQVPGGRSIYRWTGREWQIVGGGAVRIDVDPQGNPWVVNDRGDVLRFNRGAWQRLAGRGTAITIASDGTAWLLGRDRVPGGFTVQRWTGSGWRRVSGGAIALAAGSVPWVVSSEGQILRWEARR